jgi:hypothetical protein
LPERRSVKAIPSASLRITEEASEGREKTHKGKQQNVKLENRASSHAKEVNDRCMFQYSFESSSYCFHLLFFSALQKMSRGAKEADPNEWKRFRKEATTLRMRGNFKAVLHLLAY